MADWVEPGKKAPTFSLPSDDGGRVKLADLAGGPVVLYFYPRDNTPGCTREACAFRDEKAQLKKLGATVLGVSTDSVASHEKFRDKFKLNFPLLADPQGEIAKAFGVKTFKGGKFSMDIEGEPIAFERTLTAQRWTFVIDKQWKIAHVDRKVNAAKDSEKVFKVIEKQP